MVRAEECWHKSLDPLMSEIRNTIGQDTPVYLSFDIDSIDPSACPGTGTPEIGGLTTAQALEVVRGCKGLNLVSTIVYLVTVVFIHIKNIRLYNTSIIKYYLQNDSSISLE